MCADFEGVVFRQGCGVVVSAGFVDRCAVSVMAGESALLGSMQEFCVG